MHIVIEGYIGLPCFHWPKEPGKYKYAHNQEWVSKMLVKSKAEHMCSLCLVAKAHWVLFVYMDASAVDILPNLDLNSLEDGALGWFKEGVTPDISDLSCDFTLNFDDL